jgi:pyruvate/2-oxoacid:ferredoxin oxidoreductase beta subunit
LVACRNIVQRIGLGQTLVVLGEAPCSSAHGAVSNQGIHVVFGQHPEVGCGVSALISDNWRSRTALVVEGFHDGEQLLLYVPDIASR